MDNIRAVIDNIEDRMGSGYIVKILVTGILMILIGYILFKIALVKLVNILDPDNNIVIYFVTAIFLILLYNKIFYYFAIDKLYLLSDKKSNLFKIIFVPILGDYILAQEYLDAHEEIPERIPHYKALTLIIISVLFTIIVIISLIDEFITTGFVYANDRITFEHTLMVVMYSLLILFRMGVLNTLSEAVVDLTPLFKSKIRKFIYYLTVIAWIFMGIITPLLVIFNIYYLIHPIINTLSLIFPILIISPMIVQEHNKIVKSLLIQKMEEEDN